MDNPYALDVWVEWEDGVVTARCRKTRSGSCWHYVDDQERQVRFADPGELREQLEKMLFYEGPVEPKERAS